jgi:hypothetical protein
MLGSGTFILDDQVRHHTNKVLFNDCLVLVIFFYELGCALEDSRTTIRGLYIFGCYTPKITLHGCHPCEIKLIFVG